MTENFKTPYHILLIGRVAEDIHTIKYHLYHALLDKINTCKGMQEKQTHIQQDTTLKFYNAQTFGEIRYVNTD